MPISLCQEINLRELIYGNANNGESDLQNQFFIKKLKSQNESACPDFFRGHPPDFARRYVGAGGHAPVAYEMPLGA